MSWLLLIGLASGQSACPEIQLGDCGTLALQRAWHDDPGCAIQAFEARGLGLPAQVLPPLRPLQDKVERDPYGLPNALPSDNFVVRWGDDGPVTQGDAQRLSDALEHSWQVEVVELGHPAPVGTEATLMNVYIGDTGGPSAGGAGGFFWYDSEGWPMLVISKWSLGSDRGDTTAAHELFHAVQDAYGTFGYQGAGAWFYEASSSWIENEVWPDVPSYSEFLYGFSLLPELSLNFFDYFDQGTLPELHQYGAFIFLEYLEESGDTDLITQAWAAGDPDNDPLVPLGELLEARGSSLDAVWADFVAHNATWDYLHGDWFELSAQPGSYPGDYLFPSGDLWVEEGVLVSAPVGFEPHTYGANFWRLRGLQPRFTLTLSGDPGPRWSATVVGRRGAERVYLPLDISDGQGSLVVEGLDDVDEAWLVVGAMERTWAPLHSWSYSVAIDDVQAFEPEDPAPADVGGGLPPPEPKMTCGCATGGASGWPWSLGVLGLLISARRASPRPRSRNS